MATTADYKIGPQTFPRGWFMVAISSEVTDQPQGVRYFGRDFALYRGKSGRVVLLDAYCPHMGTHLSHHPIYAPRPSASPYAHTSRSSRLSVSTPWATSAPAIWARCSVA